MKVGIHARLGVESPQPSEVAALAEELGFESLFLPEHAQIPARLLQAAGDDELDLLRAQAELFDPFVALAAAVGAGNRLLLGTGVCQIAARDPIVLAKTAASLDVLSDGRFLFGIGAGSHPEEVQAHRLNPGERWATTAQRLEQALDNVAMQGLNRRQVCPPAPGPSRSARCLADHYGPGTEAVKISSRKADRPRRVSVQIGCATPSIAARPS